MPCFTVVGPRAEWFSSSATVHAMADSIELPGVVCLLLLREKVLDLTEDLQKALPERRLIAQELFDLVSRR